MHPRTPTPPLFPYTTLFRSQAVAAAHGMIDAFPAILLALVAAAAVAVLRRGRRRRSARSEEHTSELQSRPHLVCRLLLEKKKVIVADLFSYSFLICVCMTDF